jgi:hypothetical protein
MAIKATWTVQPNPIEIIVTVDGQTLTWYYTTAVTATFYYANNNAALAANLLYLDPTDFGERRAFLLEGRSVKIEARTTGGTVSNLTARVKYAKIP